MSLFETLILPNGVKIPNRIAKAAMEENLASKDNLPSAPIFNLYQAWADGGAGLIISGNVMVDQRAMTGAGGIVLESDKDLAKFSQWASVGKSKGAQFWLQLNHPGRQMPANLNQQTWAPSEVALDLGNMSKHFRPPQTMPETMIEMVIQRFVHSAYLAEQAGFDGVEVHAAHGYLLSQFLSPITNKRQDKWGGELANRARLLLEIVKQIRAKVSPKFAVAVKLNSADFQRGGFSNEEAKQVVIWLNDMQVDLVELSGGSYEAPAMQGRARDGSTLAREAYFLTFAKAIREVATMPVMVTGGIKRKSVAQKVMESGVEMVGVATALAIEPSLPNRWKSGDEVVPELRPIKWKNKAFAALANMAVVRYQLKKLSQHSTTNAKVNPLWALLKQQINDACRANYYRRKMTSSNNVNTSKVT
ncbi:NADH:flavin oxidoreductase/NADH oxidase family protein [Pseudoalteromonas piscicida]|uniref:2,4-dienoyl-CoA reductase n=1 Tax=Pseudoalteromonas piscicida TaxID=43662 RepID=A0A2A5JLN5_PSEO7|nr:NADH:flavin oxidoreductase/NADH oxidase family protein [Pseudoalteromonas piscicida]PCK30363.1 2,4-dienoyl-CoA reductase [Pseudoalteromonas piscicida]